MELWTGRHSRLNQNKSLCWGEFQMTLFFTTKTFPFTLSSKISAETQHWRMFLIVCSVLVLREFAVCIKARIEVVNVPKYWTILWTIISQQWMRKIPTRSLVYERSYDTHSSWWPQTQANHALLCLHTTPLCSPSQRSVWLIKFIFHSANRTDSR